MFSKRSNWNLAANRISETLARLRTGGQRVLDLTASNPTACGFAYDENAILRALANPEALHYEPEPRGLASAREAVVAYYAAHGRGVSADDIWLTTSTSEAYSFVLRLLCNPGDELQIPAPSYPLFEFLADLHDIQLVRYPLFYDHGWHIDFHGLESAVTERTRGIVVVHPNNPTGHFTKPEEAAKLDSLCAARGMALLVDEVFLDFALNEQRAATIAAHSEALTFRLSGLSKISGLPQMKAAWLAVSGPGEGKRQALARLEIIADTFLSMNAPVQLAMPAFFDLRHQWQPQVIRRVRKNLAELDRQLAARPSCRRLEVEGGWYATLRVPSTGPDEDLAVHLLAQKQVYVHPGHFYEFPADGFLVVSLITPERDFAEGMARLLSVF